MRLQTTFLKNASLENSKSFWVKNLPINLIFKSSYHKNFCRIWLFGVNGTVMHITLFSILIDDLEIHTKLLITNIP